MKFFYILILYSIYYNASAQVTYDTMATALQMAQLLAGKNVSVSNATIICKSNQYATFQANASWKLGIDTGLVLSTGIIRSYSPFPTPCFSIWTPNPISGISCYYGLDRPSNHRYFIDYSVHQWNHKITVQDPDLLSIVHPNTVSAWWPDVLYDRCFLQFKVVPKGDSISFDYLLASGEYHSFGLGDTNNCSSLDAFGLFISGAGIVGKKNIALIPGTNTPVNTNTIGPRLISHIAKNNYPSDTAYFLSECNGIPNADLYVFDTSNDYFPLHGRTKSLRAVQKVIPDSTYTLKFAIADIGSPGFDAFVFIRAGSLVSTGIFQPRIYSTGDTLPSPMPYAIEGCGPVQVKLRSSRTFTIPQSLSLSYGGTATLGQLSALPTTLTLPAGDSLLSFSFSALANTLSQPNRTLIIYLTNNTNYYDTLHIQILDHAKDWTLTSDTFVCKNQSVTLQSNTPISPKYKIKWSGAPLSDSTSNTPIYTANTVLDSIQVLAQLLYPTCPSISQNVNIKIKPVPTINLFSDTFVCRGDSITIAPAILPAGTYQYLFSPNIELSYVDSPSTKAFPMQNRLYSVQITSQYGCKSSKSFSIQSVASSQFLDSAQVLPDTCQKNKGAVRLFPQASFASYLDYRYASNGWQSNTMITSIPSGMQPIQIRYRNRCVLDTLLNIPNQTPQISFMPTLQRCGQPNGSLSALISNFKAPISYQWNTSSNTQSITQLDSGKYLLQATDANGCVVKDSFQMPYDKPAKISFRSIEPLCGRNNAYIVAVPQSVDTPFTYLWNSGSVSDSLHGISSGTYRVVAQDSRGCEVVDSIQIQSSNAPKINLQATPSYCNLSNGTISVTIQGGTPPFGYLWSDGNTASNRTTFISKKTYSLKITDSFGCSDTSSIFLDSIPKFSATVSIDTPYCGLSNGKMTVQVVGGIGQLNYRWNGQIGNATKNNIDSGKMTLILSDQKCTDTFAYQVTYKNKALKAIKEIVEDKICYSIQSGRIEIGLEGGLPPYSYQWSHGANTATVANLMEGTYGLVARDQQGCVYSNTYKIVTPNKIEIQDTLYHVSCYGRSDGKIKLGIVNGIEPYRYLWSNNEKTRNLSNLSSGTYKVTVENNIVCLDSFAFVIKTPPPIQFRQLQLNPPTCNNGWDGSIEALAVGGVSKMSYKLNDKPVLKKQNWMNLNAATYKITAFDSSGCEIDTFVQLVNPPKNEIEIYPKDTSIVMGSSVQMHYYATNRLQTKEWTPEMYFNCSNCDSPILSTYKDIEITLKGIDERQCEAYAKTHVYVWDSSVVFIPDAFTPTKSTNERFKVYGRSIKVAQIQIYNRWGEKVFESDKALEEGWDGQFKNESAPSGTYIYTVTCIALNNKIFKHQGNFVLIR